MEHTLALIEKAHEGDKAARDTLRGKRGEVARRRRGRF